MAAFFAWLASFFTPTPLDEALAMCIAFFACAYLVSIRRITPSYVWWVWQLLLALTITRYLGSYAIYHRSLREGAWPILWNVCAIFGAYMAARTPTKTR